MLKLILVLSVAALSLAVSASGQTGIASVAGTILDAKTQKPIPAALVIASLTAPPPLSRHIKSGGDGAFQILGLPAGKYTLCVQVTGDQYLDPCRWNGSPTTITLVSGQTASGIAVRLTAASVMRIQVQDAQKVLSQKTRDGRRPELPVGVWGPKGLYHPAHAAGSAGNFQIAVPRDTVLKLHIASRDLKLGGDKGASLTANARQLAFQHTTGDLTPKSFSFTVLGLLP